MGQRREDGSPLGPTPGDARDRFTTAVPYEGHAQWHHCIKQLPAVLKLPSGSHLRCQSDATRVGDFFQAR